MSTETKTVTVEMNVEAVYAQLVEFTTIARAYQAADEADDAEARLRAANDAVDSCIGLINDLVPAELSEELYNRMVEEHPELAPAQPSLEEIVRSLLGDDFDMAALFAEEGDED